MQFFYDKNHKNDKNTEKNKYDENNRYDKKIIKMLKWKKNTKRDDAQIKIRWTKMEKWWKYWIEKKILKMTK